MQAALFTNPAGVCGNVIRSDFEMIKIEGWIYKSFATSVLFDLVREPEPIQVLIDSIGGEALPAMEIAEAFAKHGNVQVTIQKANSAGALVALGGSHRRIYKNGSMMIHRPIPYGDYSRVDAERFNNRVIDFVTARTGLPRPVVDGWHGGRDWVFTPWDCKHVGLAHEII